LFLEQFVDPAASIHPVINWLETVEQERVACCRSDSCIGRPAATSTSRQLTRSVQDMSYMRDNDGFVVPPTPAPIGIEYVGGQISISSHAGSSTQSDITGATAASGRSSGRSLVEDPMYRDINLAVNNIYMRSSREKLPQHINDLITRMRKDRDSPGPSSDELWQDRTLELLGMGPTKPEVEKYFQGRIFPDCGPDDSLKRSDRQPMAKHTVPNVGDKLKVSTPVPDMLYGYHRQNAFPKQQGQLITMGTEMVATSQGLIYPFLVIEFKGDGPSGSGSLWVATNQCLGGSASCVNTAERLNRQLQQCTSHAIQAIDSAAFSIALNGTEARLYVSWKHNELDYYMVNIDSFLVQKPKDYVEFRKYVRNIIDWGREKRLDEIRNSLDILLEESKKQILETVKTRPPPSDASATNSGKRRRSSASRSSSKST
jgi:hypothetical protein